MIRRQNRSQRQPRQYGQIRYACYISEKIIGDTHLLLKVGLMIPEPSMHTNLVVMI